MILDRFKLDGKVAIVTGSRRGLGQGMAVGLAEAGADIVSFDRNDPASTRAKVEALVADICGCGWIWSLPHLRISPG